MKTARIVRKKKIYSAFIIPLKLVYIIHNTHTVYIYACVSLNTLGDIMQLRLTVTFVSIELNVSFLLGRPLIF